MRATPKEYPEIPVEYSAEGTAIFHCNRSMSVLEKMTYFTELQKGLAQEFGKGFSVAFAPSSDCSDANEIAFFCQTMKELDTGIITVIKDKAVRYIPATEQASLVNAWEAEPYNSAPLIAGEKVAPYKDSITAKLVDGVDYVVSNVWENASPLIHDKLGVDAALSPRDNYETHDMITVNQAQADQIQNITNRAFKIAMGQGLKLDFGSRLP